jgi:hypothetical protein
MKKFALAAVCTLAIVGFVTADEFIATITKVEGSKVTYMKGKKDEAKEGSAEAAANVKVLKGMKDDSGAYKAGDAVAKGLKDDMFSNIAKGLKAQITTDDKSGKITQIMLIKGKGKGGQ